MRCQGVTIRDQSGKAVRVVGAQSDITRRKEMEERLARDAIHDQVTGLPNRVLFLDRLERAWEAIKRSPDQTFAVAVVDLDRFKHINDSLGHSVGDRLLGAVARRLSGCIGKGDTLARLGGDEFGVLCEGANHAHVVIETVKRVEASLRAPVTVDGRQIPVSASIGIALGSADYESAEDALRDADTAVYQAKDAGRGGHQVFAGKMREAVERFIEIEHAMWRALETNSIKVVFQPIIDLDPLRVAGLEALARWVHPHLGPLSPSEFIPVAEETGAIVALGEQVLRAACRALREWRRTTGQDLYVSVNLSPRQLAEPDVVESISRVIREAGVMPDTVRLEITEGVFLRDLDRARRLLTELSQLGIGISLDDFGTGYSSLGYLTPLPLHSLKIDRSFITKLLDHRRDAALVAGIINLAQSLGLRVVAEGVEEGAESALLRELGCDQVQGFLYSRALPEDEVERFLLEADLSALEQTAVPPPQAVCARAQRQSGARLSSKELRTIELMRGLTPPPGRHLR